MRQSLKGKLVVVTRTVGGNRMWKKYLAQHGASVYELPTLKIEAIKPTAALLQALRNISDFDWIVITSAAGIRALKSIGEKTGIDTSGDCVPPLTAIGSGTAKVARQMGYKIAFSPSESTSERLAAELEGEPEALTGQSILLLRADIATSELPNELKKRGATVTALPIYRTALISKPDLDFEKNLHTPDKKYFIFASPSSIEGFRLRISRSAFEAVKKLPVIALGKTTAKALTEAGFQDVRIAKKPTIEEVVDRMV